MIKIDVSRKYLHFERFGDGKTYIWASNTKHGGKQVTLKQMDNECLVSVDSVFHLIVPLKDFLEAKLNHENS